MINQINMMYIGTDRIKPCWVKTLGPIDWEYLSLNSAAISLLEANKNKINWSMMSENPAAIDLLTVNKDKINWWLVFLNSAIYLLEENKVKVNKYDIWRNPAIFEPYADHFTLLMLIKF